MKTIQQVLGDCWRECRVGLSGLEFAQDIEAALDNAGYVIHQKCVGAELLNQANERSEMDEHHRLAREGLWP